MVLPHIVNALLLTSAYAVGNFERIILRELCMGCHWITKHQKQSPIVAKQEFQFIKS